MDTLILWWSDDSQEFKTAYKKMGLNLHLKYII